MPSILADVNLDGHFERLAALLSREDNAEYWEDLGFDLLTFRDLGWERNLADDEVWRRCQAARLVLVTSNRNQHGPNSLEAAIRNADQSSLPVLTISRPDRFLTDRLYAENVVRQVLNYLSTLDQYLGTGRLYLP